MARPHPALIELAAGRPMPRSVPDPHHLVNTAVEHRVHGLLWSAVMRGDIELPLHLERSLAALDLKTQAHHRKLWAALEEVTETLGERGIEVATFKGVTAEARWYHRMGERPSRDLDLWLNPDQFDRIDEAVELLHPGHPLEGEVGSLAKRRALQSVDLTSSGVDIDFHFDPLKLGVWIHDLPGLWKHTEIVGHHRATDESLALVQFLLHLNKDRFSWLLGLVDVVRLGDSSPEALDLAEEIGAAGPITASLHATSEHLGIDDPWSKQPSSLWSRLWPKRIQLQGDEGYARAHRRQFVLPLFVAFTPRARFRFYWNLVFPPRQLIHYWYSDIDGGAARRLVIGRAVRIRDRLVSR